MKLLLDFTLLFMLSCILGVVVGSLAFVAAWHVTPDVAKDFGVLVTSTITTATFLFLLFTFLLERREQQKAKKQ